MSGFVYNDADNNGLKETGEAGIAGVLVTLSGANGFHMTQTTDSNGFYDFTNLAPGTYAIRIGQPAGYIEGQATIGTQGGTVVGGSLSNIALGANVDGSGNNFGELANADGWTSIQSNFNGTAIQAGSFIWFNSVLKVNGLGSNPVTLHFTNQVISFAAQGSNYALSVPDSTIILSPTATSATTSFNSASNSWTTTLPFNFSGNGFLSGFAFPVTASLPGGISPVVWTGRLSSDTAGLNVNWQWAASVYTNFSSNYGALGVKPVDDNHVSQYQNSDHAGTPENYKAFLGQGGATGGGGSNFTGSYSATGHVLAPQLSTLSGLVFDEGTNQGLANVMITLTGVNDRGQFVTITTMTSANGSYSFVGLRAGTYSITESPPSGYQDDHNSVGTAGGTSSSNQFTNITLNAGVNGLNYNFGDIFGGIGGGS